MKIKKNRFATFAVGCLLLTACGGVDKSEAYGDQSNTSGAMSNYDDGYADYAEEPSVDGEYDMSATEQTTSVDLKDQMTIERKLIKNANLSFETDSLNNRRIIVDAAIKEFGAYVEQEEQYTSYDRENISATIRVPAIHFEAFIEKATKGVGTFDNKTISADDVTEEYVDLEARIHTKKELKIRFIKLLDKAQSIVQIMEVEREINALQAEIESYQGRLKYLSGSVKYATVIMNYYQLIEVPTHFDNKFENAFSTGWQGLIWFFVGLVSIWPFILILALVGLFIRFRMKRKKKKLTQRTSAKQN